MRTSSEASGDTPRTCLVCKAPAHYSYFGAVVCISCKMFFRRYAEVGQVKFQCAWNEECELDPNNRRICSACRLAKCFQSGMSPEKIRAGRAPTKKPLTRVPSTKVSTELPAKHQIGMCNERFLSNAQQTLLTNLVRCFDEHCGLTLISEFQQQQISLPMKLRYRHVPVRRFFTTLFSRVQRVVEKTRDFHSLSGQDRSTLLHTTTRYTSLLAGVFLLHSSGLFDDPSFFQSVEMIFRPATASSIRLLLAQLDSDLTLIKLLLASLAFSSTNSPVFLNRTPTILINSKTMWAIEEMYIELTWRYLLANCEGEAEAVRRFSRLTRCLLLLNQVVAQAQDERQFEEIIERVVQAIEDEWKFPH